MVLKARGAAPLQVAVIDGPYDVAALSGILARESVSLGNGRCRADPNMACHHGTFVMGLLGARSDAPIPGLCPECTLVHVPLFVDDHAPSASVAKLASAITVAVATGARLINLSLGIQGADSENSRELAVALDRAEASGAVVVVAAGNQGRMATGQLLSHPVTVPVVAVDAAHRLLPDCNFGPLISRRGIAALGHEVLGYAPGGGVAVMSGTSVATAVATGSLAQLWQARPEADGAAIRAVIARLAPRNAPVPPMIEPNVFLAALDRTEPTRVAVGSQAAFGKTNYAILQGETAMTAEIGLPVLLNRVTGPAAMPAQAVTPAHGLGGCACGTPGGVCTCTNGEQAASRFIYVLGTVDIRFPDQSISEELHAVAATIKSDQKDREDVRAWCHRVLTKSKARYVARQLCWILTVEGHPAYYLALRDLHDLDDLVSCLGEPRGDDLCLFVGSSTLIPAEACPGVVAPVLDVDQLCFFKKDTQIKLFPTPSTSTPPETTPPAKPAPTVDDLFKKLVQSADNFGETDEWRALNYLAVRYHPLYYKYAEMLLNDYILDGIKVMRSRLWGEKRILDPVFAFRHTKTGVVQKYFVRLDMSHLFPMVVTPIGEYFDR